MTAIHQPKTITRYGQFAARQRNSAIARFILALLNIAAYSTSRAFQIISRAPYDRDSEGTEGAASAAGVALCWRYSTSQLAQQQCISNFSRSL
jgi:hypothetical protein